jgi:hypothetical protein
MVNNMINKLTVVHKMHNSTYVSADATKHFHDSDSFQNAEIRLSPCTKFFKSLNNKITFTSLRSTLREIILSVWAQ